jgi:hypothetical protein
MSIVAIAAVATIAVRQPLRVIVAIRLIIDVLIIAAKDLLILAPGAHLIIRQSCDVFGDLIIAR